MKDNMKKTISVFKTARDTGDLLTQKDDLNFLLEGSVSEDVKVVDEHMILNPQKRFQTIVGFGGAFTEAAGYALSFLPKEKRDAVIKSYFHPTEGIGYSICRTHINSCDFSLDNYAYCEVDGDIDLEHFSIERDRKYLLPFIHDAKKVEGADFLLFASPWSPPAWMKTNGEMNNGGQLKSEYQETWARYYAKYIKVYKEEENLDIWGVSVQNEPAALQTWDSCLYSGEEERDFVKNYLGPVFEKEGLTDKKIVIWDHNRDIIVERAKAVLSDPEAAKYIWGVGVHWYVSEEFENLSEVHNLFPETNILFTEGCEEGGVKLGEWRVGERYGRNIIGDLNNWAVGWMDWNMVLDETGGPNHVGNFCDAPIIANKETGEVTYEMSYYYMGHFSKFIRPRAVKISLESISKGDIQSVAFKNEDGTYVLVLMNESDNDQVIDIDTVEGKIVVEVEKHSIVTLKY